MIHRSLFIVFEGIDGSGKSTQARRCHQHIADAGIETILLSEPSAGEWGSRIRTFLTSPTAPAPEEQHRLFLLDREDDVRRNVTPALACGISVIMDRYFFSNAAYQGAGGLPPQRILEDNRAMGFPEPHRVYLIDIPPETALARVSLRNRGGDTELFERIPILERVRAIYLDIADETFTVIDGSGSEEDVFHRIAGDLRSRFDIG
ncbi:MAG: dTMP kinase [Spirochaetes bacterium]|nr:dTMP kinase [Spirochaetota bacterium]